ncbi:hypothetical protein A2U01_0098954 [Trifolium medium]|nr:hypothetical protein [Trifolium medium]
MRHQNENPQCYRVDVVEELEEEITQDEPPIRSTEQVNVHAEENKKKGGNRKQETDESSYGNSKNTSEKEKKKMEE